MTSLIPSIETERDRLLARIRELETALASRDKTIEELKWAHVSVEAQVTRKRVMTKRRAPTKRGGGCSDCERPYGHQHGFPDLIIPFWAWQRISPNGDDSGLLCPSCICKRLHDARISCEGAFMSGPIISVSQPVMYALRRVENIELAINGRDNAFSAVRDLIVQPGKKKRRVA